ncbi:LPXTG cell wall anchor domain-containing protein [Enterococcus gilvus]|uniref:LPXTG cell wall anchor domain-containing protein n=1 Tax=Enterococcus gilvus TaxID=160453 RepID=UPI0036F33D3E
MNGNLTDFKKEIHSQDSSQTAVLITIKNAEDVVPNPNEVVYCGVSSINCRGHPSLPQTNVTDSSILTSIGINLIIFLIFILLKKRRKRRPNE